MRILLCIFILLPASAQMTYLNGNRPITDAHNCYPEMGQHKDRLSRALSTGFPIGIEQDVAGVDGVPVVSHTPKTTGGEPTLREHFFEHVRPMVEKALAANERSKWPLIVVHFDFKSNDPAVLRNVWKLLGEYEGWITTAKQTKDPNEISPFEAKPLLVLTEVNDEQEKIFFREIPAGGKLRLFGSAHTNSEKTRGKTREETMHLAATVPPADMLTERPTNYRRWWNLPWAVVEEGGQTKAGDWTAEDAARLKSIVKHAHDLGYWIRFYTLDGFAANENQGWSAIYNFGSRAAVLPRWKAAIEAGVNLIATDQYEAFSELLAK